MYHGMPDQFRFPFVRFLADVTGVRFLATVSQHVIAERRFLSEGSMTERAFEMFVHRVKRQMHVQFCLLLKRLEADRAFVGPVRRVTGHVSI